MAKPKMAEGMTHAPTPLSCQRRMQRNVTKNKGGCLKRPARNLKQVISPTKVVQFEVLLILLWLNDRIAGS